jgi:DNA polymerase-3 subunit alpha
LVLAGAFDNFEFKREQYFEIAQDGELFIDTLLRYGVRYQVDQQQQQNSLFGDFEELAVVKPQPAKVFNKWSDIERLNKERELIGIYISAHPLDSYHIVLNNLCTATLEQLQDRAAYANQDITFGGIVNGIAKEGQTKNGSPFGIAVLEDYSGTLEIPMFGEEWARWKGYFTVGNPLFITAKIEPHRFRPNEYDLRIGKIEFLSDIKDKKVEKLTVDISLEKLTEDIMEEFIALVDSSPGTTSLFISIKDNETKTNIHLLSHTHTINVNKKVLDFLSEKQMFSYTIN